MSDQELTRRNLLRNAALAASLGGLSADAAQHVHNAARAETADSGAYSPKVFKPHEWIALDALAELIVPGARKAGAKEFIDLLCSGSPELADIFTGGLAWLDRESASRFSVAFTKAAAEHQTSLLDLIAFRDVTAPELLPGVAFFAWARKMVVDAYYTSAVGIEELGYSGNKGMTEFSVPQEAIDYAIRRSPE